MAWVGLQEEITATFDGLATCVDVSELDGFRSAGYWTRTTTKEAQTPTQRREKRQALENNRRAYKTAKQREYDARKRAA